MKQWMKLSGSLTFLSIFFIIGLYSATPTLAADSTKHCFSSVEEYINTPQNMGNFDWPICDDAKQASSSSLSDFGNSPDPMNATNVDLSQFDNPNNPSPFDQFDTYKPINVPLRNQNDPANGALGPSACGPTSLDMIAAFYGIDIPTSTIIQDAGTTNTGTNLSNLADAAKQIGLTGTTINDSVVGSLVDAFTGGSSALSGVTDAVSSGEPVIVNVDLDQYSNGHAVVVTGITSDSVYINNPWDGQAQVIGKTQFMAMWGSKGYGYIVPKP